MKRLTIRYRRWLRHRATKEANKAKKERAQQKRRSGRHVVDAWFGSHQEKLVVRSGAVSPPAVLCFDRNRKETLAFFDSLRRTLNRSFRAASAVTNGSAGGTRWVLPGRHPTSLRRINWYHDYSKIESISTAAALVLAAEYDRFARLCQSVPPTINLHAWHPELFRKLYEVGFFEIVGLAEDVAERYRTDGGVRVMRIVSGVDAREIDEAANAILELVSFIGEVSALDPSVELALNSSLGEAMINVARHAYPEDEEFEVPHVQRWWVTGSADRNRKELTVVIYDQGASIPVTFPKKMLVDTVVDFLRGAVGKEQKFAFAHDGAYIAAALLPGSTQTNQIYQGLGLPEMKELIDISGDGDLSIFSRGGTYSYDSEGKALRGASEYSVGGTLIQWRLKIGQRELENG